MAFFVLLTWVDRGSAFQILGALTACPRRELVALKSRTQMPSGTDEVGREVCPPAGQKAGPAGAALLGSFQQNPVGKEGGPPLLDNMLRRPDSFTTQQMLARHRLCAKH